MQQIQMNQATLVTGGSQSFFSPLEGLPSSLLKTLSKDALYGSVGMSLLFSPAGLGIASVGLATGFALGLGVGYIEWIAFG